MTKIKHKAFYDNGKTIHCNNIYSTQQVFGKATTLTYSAPETNQRRQNEFQFHSAGPGQRSYPFTADPPFQKDRPSDATVTLNDIDEVGESMTMSTAIIEDNLNEYSDVFDIDNDEIFADVENITTPSQSQALAVEAAHDDCSQQAQEQTDHFPQVASAPAQEKSAQLDTSKVEAKTPIFDKIDQDRQRMTTFQLGEVELQSEFDLFDEIMDRSKQKSISQSKPSEEFATLSEMDIAEDFEYISDKIEANSGVSEAKKLEKPNPKPVVVNMGRMFEDQVAVLSLVTIRINDKVFKFYSLRDKKSHFPKGGDFVSSIKFLPQSSPSTAPLVDRFKQASLGISEEGTLVLNLHESPISKGMTRDGHTIHDVSGLEVLGDTLWLDSKLEQEWEKERPGVIGNYLKIGDNAKTLNDFLQHLEASYTLDKYHRSIPDLHIAISIGVGSDSHELRKLLEKGAVGASQFYQSLMKLKNIDTPIIQ